MSQYRVPARDILFAIEHVADLEGVNRLPGCQEATPEAISAILVEAGKLAEKVLDPLNRIGDKQGVRLQDGKVRTPDGWGAAWRQFIAGGWNGIPFDPKRGGMGLPWLVAAAVQEIWHSSNMAFSLCTLLNQGAIAAIDRHGSSAQKDTFLGNLIHGNWCGTMNLTEPQAGSDLGLVKTLATPHGDHYLLSGQKIFITYGDHDMTDNIVHLVLARTPAAPRGVKGISLFIVPKYLPDEDGNWTVRNDVETLSLERKLGIHGSPTAVLGYGTGRYRDPAGAVGWLVGEENRGMACMFTMMNVARLAVGLEGNGVAERAYQQAVWFAGERVQGCAIGNTDGERVAIIDHPDVKRMLMLQKCRIEGLRSLGLALGGSLDKALKSPDPQTREPAQAMVDILTPIVKGYMTEMGLENVSLALQVHGGMGFIEETGAAQYYRDQRITPIYEGTNGIQALDLIGRKLVRDNGRTARIVIGHMRNDMSNVHQSELNDLRDRALAGIDDLEAVIESILVMAADDMRKPASIADPYLRLWGVVCCAWQLARAASAAMALGADSDRFYAAKIETARFYFACEMPKAACYRSIITQAAGAVARLDAGLFETLQ